MLDAPTDRPAFRAAVLSWYDSRGRTLPFRGTADAYLVLVSETMAQQTQISRVGPAWATFVARFPSFEVLAAATPADVLRAWAGLGYNRRALNLQRAARTVVAEHGGRLPSDLAALQRLPGVGPYTARAVGAIAFGAPVGAVDTNVRRVLGRVVDGVAGARSPAALQELADLLVAPHRAADWTHAVMDVGATFCRSRAPRCEACPARPWCHYAAQAGTAERAVPVAASRAGTPVRAGAPVRAGTPVRAAAPVRAGTLVRAAAPFTNTTRWLRGRILDRLRMVDGAGWATFDEAIGPHDAPAVAGALAALARDGLVELSAGEPTHARLPHALG